METKKLQEADFANPFSGKLPDRKLTGEELIRAIRLDIAAEEEAIHLYKAHADATDNRYAKKVLNSIADEEVVHVGELQKLLSQLDKKEAELLNKGAEEASPAIIGKGSIINKESKMNEARHSFSKCMDCNKPPDVELLWAEGMGHAWFCMKHFEKWAGSKEHQGDICSVKEIQNGKAVKKWSENTTPDIRRKFKFCNHKPGGTMEEVESYRMATFKELKDIANEKKGNKMQKITEAIDVKLYSRLLRVFGSFISQYPMTSMDSIFDIMVEKGKKVLPSDKRALAILQYLIDETDVGASVQKLMNTRFSDLPPNLKPISKTGNKHVIALWKKKDKMFDLTKDLLNLDDSGSGSWSDAEGKKITILNTNND